MHIKKVELVRGEADLEAVSESEETYQEVYAIIL